MARSIKSFTLSVLTKDADAKSKIRTFKSVDPKITDETVLAIAELVNSFVDDDLQKPIVTRADEIDIEG
ncbi:hypothetical protein [Lacticaseibacillus manihotivorans]|uniref:Uncharacterized protein n=1 Tax=Lacticaseibacillus manihotivorans TaxID=88233 RepID=A0A5P8JRM6_9LACO|nr:hypothetical protein [Lacticaseibacillus manihotivorans]QFQ91905.1 hypothetical protein LM010_10930 [Lacticaseibacillus manihotivorans]